LAGTAARLRSALVVAEVALAVLLVIGAGLMARSFLALRSVDAGFDPNRCSPSPAAQLAGVPGGSDIASFLIQRREEILERVRALPGVESAGMINVFPLRTGRRVLPGVHAAAARSADARRNRRARGHALRRRPDYLATMGSPCFAVSRCPTQLPRSGRCPWS
jgi:hypothetical protein